MITRLNNLIQINKIDYTEVLFIFKKKNEKQYDTDEFSGFTYVLCNVKFYIRIKLK